MAEFEITEKQYESFVSSISRFRWIVLINIILSCSFLVHIYSENGMSAAQIKITMHRKLIEDAMNDIVNERKKIPNDPIYNDLSNINKADIDTKHISIFMRIVEFKKKKEDLIRLLNDGLKEVPTEKTLLNKKIGELEQKSSQIADDLSGAYGAMMFGNRIASDQIHKRTVPLLNMDVEHNDFSSIIEIMMVVFVIAMWLVLENIKFQIDWLKVNLQIDSNNFNALIRSNFLFNVSNDTHLTIAIQRFAILLPLIVALICVWFDLRPGLLDFILSEKNINIAFGTENAQILRGFIAGMSVIVIAVFSTKSLIASKNIDQKIKV